MLPLTNKSILKVILAFLLIIPSYSFAASVSLDTPKNSFIKDEEFLLQVSVNTEQEPLNAIEGKLTFPGDLLDIKEIRDGNSKVIFWIDRPKLTDAGVISFSGITPGGYNGEKQYIFSVVFKSKVSGEGSITLNGLKLLKNDGSGTEAIAKTAPFNFFIQKNGMSLQINTIEPVVENGAPEKFKAEIARNDEMFNGKYFIVFDTSDKGSGIDHYEIREGFWGDFKTVTSPFVLQNQNIDKKIIIKAFDRDGNVLSQTVYPANWKPWYRDYPVLALVILLLVAIIYFARKLPSVENL